VVFVHGLLWDSTMFEHQMAALEGKYRCIAIDLRGHGKTQVAEVGYGISDQSLDVQKIIEHLAIDRYHFIGLSKGGFMGMRLAVWEPERVLSLTLIETSAGPEPKATLRKYRKLAWVARWFGIGIIAKKVMPIMFGKTFMTDPNKASQRAHWLEKLKANSKLGVQLGTHGVIEREDYRPRLENITAPTLVMVGDEDFATPVEKAEDIVAGIKGAELCVISGAGHSSSVEQPEFVTEKVESFLGQCSAS